VLEDSKVIFRTVETKFYRDYLGYDRWFYQGDQFPVVQCVWPDSKHRYPWHPEVSQTIVALQPVLSDDKSWQFQAGKNRATFTTKPVLRDGHPVLLVVHDEEGDWQFLCGTTNQQEDAQIVGLGTIVRLDPTLAELAELPVGWQASRDAVGTEWSKESMEED